MKKQEVKVKVNKEPKKKLSTLELAMKIPDGTFKNLHKILEPHEIPSQREIIYSHFIKNKK